MDRDGFIAREEASERSFTSKEQAREVTNEILALLDDRAFLLGKPELTLPSKCELIGILDRYQLLTTEEFVEHMSAEIYITRDKVFEAIARYEDTLRQPDNAVLQEQLRRSQAQVIHLRERYRRVTPWSCFVLLLCLMVVALTAILVVVLIKASSGDEQNGATSSRAQKPLHMGCMSMRCYRQR